MKPALIMLVNDLWQSQDGGGASVSVPLTSVSFWASFGSWDGKHHLAERFFFHCDQFQSVLIGGERSTIMVLYLWVSAEFNTFSLSVNICMKLICEIICWLGVRHHQYVLVQSPRAAQVWMEKNMLKSNPDKAQWLCLFDHIVSQNSPSVTLRRVALPHSRLTYKLEFCQPPLDRLDSIGNNNRILQVCFSLYTPINQGSICLIFFKMLSCCSGF